MYYNARYYDPDLGRFLQADTYLDGMNRYTYCGNNPVIYTDPTGHFIFSALLSVLGPVGTVVGGILDGACWGAVIGGGVNAAIQGINILSGNQDSFNTDSFFQSMGLGALGGAIGGGVSSAISLLAPSVGGAAGGTSGAVTFYGPSSIPWSTMEYSGGAVVSALPYLPQGIAAATSSVNSLINIFQNPQGSTNSGTTNSTLPEGGTYSSDGIFYYNSDSTYYYNPTAREWEEVQYINATIPSYLSKNGLFSSTGKNTGKIFRWMKNGFTKNTLHGSQLYNPFNGRFTTTRKLFLGAANSPTGHFISGLGNGLFGSGIEPDLPTRGYRIGKFFGDIGSFFLDK